MTSAADRVGAGLAASRPARPIRPLERIHVVGAAGAGASAAALLGARAGAVVSGCDPAAPSPYTPALDALGIEIAPQHDPAHVTRLPASGPPGRHQGADRDRPRPPGAGTRRAPPGIPLEPWQQVVADAAVGRTLVGVAGTHGKSTTAGWLVHVAGRGRRDPVGVRRRADARRRSPAAPPATARWGQGDAFVVEADEYAGNFDAYHPELAVLTSAEWDHPDVFADEDAVVAAFEAWIRRAPDVARPLVANVGDPGVEAVLDRLRGLAGDRSSRTRSSTRRRSGWAATRGRSASGSRPRTGPRRRSSAGSPASDPAVARRSSSTASTHWPDPSRPGCRPPAATTRPTPSRWPAPRRARPAHPTRSRRRAGHVRGDRSAPRAQGRGGRRRGLRRLRPPPDGDPRDAGRRPPARAGPAASGPSTSRSPSTGRRRCSAPSPTSCPPRTRVAIADIWAGRDPDTTIASAAGPGRGRRGPPARAPGPRPGLGRGHRRPPRRRGPVRRRRAGHGRRRELSDR